MTTDPVEAVERVRAFRDALRHTGVFAAALAAGYDPAFGVSYPVGLDQFAADLEALLAAKEAVERALLRLDPDYAMRGGNPCDYPGCLCDHDDICHVAIPESRAQAAEAKAAGLVGAVPDDFRAAGWSVAVHNDYRQFGAPYTFWLLTHPDGRWLKGEGASDTEALNGARARLQAAALSAAQAQPVGGE